MKKSSFLLFVSVLIVATPGADVFPGASYFILGIFFLCFLFANITFGRVTIGQFGLAAGLYVFLFPILVCLIFSQSRFLIFGGEISINDLSEYIKFLFPLIVFWFVALCVNKEYKKTALKFIDYSSCLYSFVAVFVIFSYIFEFQWVPEAIGFLEHQRMLGLDGNPNAYCAIATLLLVVNYALILNNLEFRRVLIFGILFASIIFSQSRNGVVYAGVSLILVTLLVRGIGVRGIVFAIISIFIILLVYNFLDLSYLKNERAYDLEANNSWIVRVDNSLDYVEYYKNQIGFFGIGPAKSEFRALDLIGYFIYYIRYGFVGLMFWILFHFRIALYFFRNLVREKNIKNGKPEMISLLSALVVYPLISLLATLTNDKWIDPKFLFIWFCLNALIVLYIKSKKSHVKENCSPYFRPLTL